MSQLRQSPSAEAERVERPRAEPPRRREWFTRRWFDNRMLPVLFLAPATVFIFGLTIWPVLQALHLSFTSADLGTLMTGEHEYIGFENYANVVTSSQLRGVFVVTALFGFACVIATMVMGIGTALLLNQRFAGRWLLAVMVLLPWAVSNVAAGIVWKWMFDDQYGVVNWGLSTIGLGGFAGFPWFNHQLSAFLAIGVVVVWQSFPFIALCMLAGLQSLSEEVLDAARVDGASPWQLLRRIILPILKPLILVLVVISTIWDFKIVDQEFVMTGGGPARATELVAITTWREAFTQHDFGLSSALAMALFVVISLVIVAYLWLIRDDEDLT